MVTKLNDNAEKLVLDIISRFQRRDIKGSFDAATATVLLMRDVISQSRWNTAAEIMDIVRAVGKRVATAMPNELTVGTMTRRVLYIIREEYAADESNRKSSQQNQQTTAPNVIQLKTLQRLVTVKLDQHSAYKEEKKDLKGSLMEGLKELKLELDNSRHNISMHAQDLIHANEIILVYGLSTTVESFLLSAYKRHSQKGIRFFVVVVEAAPSYGGHMAAQRLSAEGMATTIITDAAVYAIMARVNKVIVGTNGIMADGGLMAPSGTLNIALAAEAHAVPVIVLSALYKLATTFPCAYDPDEFCAVGDPEQTYKYADAGIHHSGQIQTPLYDYVPPNLISLYVTNSGGHAPTYIYRLLSEYYHPDDQIL
ncbi:hypothetical protein SARC_03910 [Sphaeroforma arctica JP610]|uniref:Translation initiation factor eIF2B subunit beta n=1 Tax=Sphaeroforma arctica JP610 TaxID=667725 RepID=A0A0L0G6J3_9EUKA|nr:hypothetical protein SARC_03910 [Sphaeroforma arctica JP610]KNC83853.1 hypothetical protein SARC_03910 [Sphaeroforma arctica JP610]|eukprot:XP_014157755.1 hypothetical protein SARC_03910 [Sphaeroforma arctica JP610]